MDSAITLQCFERFVVEREVENLKGMLEVNEANGLQPKLVTPARPEESEENVLSITTLPSKDC